MPSRSRERISNDSLLNGQSNRAIVHKRRQAASKR
jgi:hypothetical protein